MKELLVDFAGVRDFETIKARLLSLFQDFPGEVRCVEVTFHKRSVSGAAAKNRERTESEDASDFAGHNSGVDCRIRQR
jgi:putative methionine-R-sulfoxide reductase with GAF domain